MLRVRWSYQLRSSLSYKTRIRSKEGFSISLRIVVAMAATCLSVDIPDPRHQQALKYSSFGLKKQNWIHQLFIRLISAESVLSSEGS